MYVHQVLFFIVRASDGSVRLQEIARQQEYASRWLALPNDTRQKVKEETMKTLASPQSKAGSVAAQVVAAIASVELPVGEWPEAIELLLRFVQTSEDVHLKVSTFQAIGYICESIVSGSFKQ